MADIMTNKDGGPTPFGCGAMLGAIVAICILLYQLLTGVIDFKI